MRLTVENAIYKRTFRQAGSAQELAEAIQQCNDRCGDVLDEAEREALRIVGECRPGDPIRDDAGHLLRLLKCLRLARKANRPIENLIFWIGRFRERLYARQFEAEVVTRRRQQAGRAKHTEELNAKSKEKHATVVEYWLTLRKQGLILTKADRETAQNYDMDERTVRRITQTHRRPNK